MLRLSYKFINVNIALFMMLIEILSYFSSYEQK